MKKIATLLMAAAMLVAGMGNAQAIDFKVKGQWIMSFEYGKNGNFTGGNGQTGYNGKEDEFEAEQRLRLQIDAVASESLSGTVFFELGDQRWGYAKQGGALGADGTNVVEVKRAYLDWLVPNTDLKIRMGIQGIALPSFTTQSQVFNDDVAGITASYTFNENVALSAFWARPMNDNFTGYDNGVRNDYRANYMDNVDMFGLVLPLKFDGVKVTPWAMYAAIGPNALRVGDADRNYFDQSWGVSATQFQRGMTAVGGGSHHEKLTSYGNAIWAGLTADIVAFDPFRVAFDFNYGSVAYDDSSANRSGWLASLLAEYKLDWGIIGVHGWYSSGDDDDTGNGSERMPYVSMGNTNTAFSNFAFNGDPYLGREGVVGYGIVGTWGVGAYVRDFSFVENLKHTFRVNLFGGTNSTDMAKVVGSPNSSMWGKDAMYMTTNDMAMEFTLINNYKIYENMDIRLTASYIAMWLDKSDDVWGNAKLNGRSPDSRDAWDISLAYIYSF